MMMAELSTERSDVVAVVVAIAAVTDVIAIAVAVAAVAY